MNGSQATNLHTASINQAKRPEFYKYIDFGRDPQKNFLWVSRLWVGWRKDLIKLCHEKQRKKTSCSNGLKHLIVVLKHKTVYIKHMIVDIKNLTVVIKHITVFIKSDIFSMHKSRNIGKRTTMTLLSFVFEIFKHDDWEEFMRNNFLPFLQFALMPALWR